MNEDWQRVAETAVAYREYAQHLSDRLLPLAKEMTHIDPRWSEAIFHAFSPDPWPGEEFGELFPNEWVTDLARWVAIREAMNTLAREGMWGVHQLDEKIAFAKHQHSIAAVSDDEQARVLVLSRNGHN